MVCSKLLIDTEAAAQSLMDLNSQVHVAQFCPQKSHGNCVTFEVLVSRGAQISALRSGQWEGTVPSLCTAGTTGSSCDQSRFQMEPRPGSWLQVLGRLSKYRRLLSAEGALEVPLCCVLTPP